MTGMLKCKEFPYIFLIEASLESIIGFLTYFFIRNASKSEMGGLLSIAGLLTCVSPKITLTKEREDRLSIVGLPTKLLPQNPHKRGIESVLSIARQPIICIFPIIKRML
ncbi:hypothetical protein O6H91_07G132300 [Diphasiastrum complanatum]|uniref:Uncharacterized protein n=1 Tax=Diphasiastrum complanatum TaxID=34168 RepID=A0ACC2DAC5_DIPCM|nr:hypothetical protein O6H91_07G132300 [Diphasiastrum complanatum]